MTLRSPRPGYFSLTGSFEPNDISIRLGLEPSWSWKIGEVNPETGLPRLAGLWCLVCSNEEAGDVQDQVIYLLSRLRPCGDEVCSLSAEFSGTMNLIAYLDGTYPGFYLSAGTIIELASLNVTINCDYCYVNDKTAGSHAN